MMIHFDAIPVTLDAAAGEDAPKTITGLAAPWDVPATVSTGQTVMFKRGAFDVTAKAPKLLENHDMGQLRGVVTSLADLPEGLGFTATFADTSAARDAINLVKAGAYDSVSVGAIPVKYKYNKDNVMVVSEARLVEISLVGVPAFDQAVITEIAASEPEQEATETPTPTETEEVSMSTENTTVPAVEAAVIPTTPIYATVKKEQPLPSAAEYISAALMGGDRWAKMQSAIAASAPDVTTSETPGLLPEPIVAPVYNALIGRRSLIDAIGTKAMPQSGKIFLRPWVQTHTTIGPSNGENQPLDAGEFVVNSEPVTKGVYGGYVKLSEEDMDWSSPEVVSLLLDDMARVYAQQTEIAVETDFESKITVTETFSDSSDPEDWANFVWSCAETILSSTTHLPTHLFVSPDYWAALGKLIDQAGRPLFPQVGPMNAFGNVNPSTLSANAFGLQVVVCPNSTGFCAVGQPDGYEIYEQQKGALSVEATDGSLSRIIKYRGYLATLMIDADKFVKQGAGA